MWINHIDNMFGVRGASFLWESDFPKGFGHTSIAFLKRCLGFISAKNGDISAARSIVKKCVKPNRINEIKEKFPCATLIPIPGYNALPLALAEEIGLPIWDNLIRIDLTPRKNLSAIQRVLHKPTFAGRIQSGTEYIIVDDIVVQGGTISAMRKFVMANGGKIVAVVALAYAIDSRKLAPSQDMIFRLYFKFGFSICALQAIGLVADTFEELTYSQVKYLLMYSSVLNICNNLAEAENASLSVADGMRKVYKVAECDRYETDFSGDITYFPTRKKRRVRVASADSALTNEQKVLLDGWVALTREQQRGLLLELIRSLNTH